MQQRKLRGTRISAYQVFRTSSLQSHDPVRDAQRLFNVATFDNRRVMVMPLWRKKPQSSSVTTSPAQRFHVTGDRDFESQ